MRKNNFQRLEDEELDRLPDLPFSIANNVHNRLNNMRTIGNVIELYLTKVIDVLVMMTGGKSKPASKNSFTDTSGHGSPTEPDIDGPGGPAGNH